MIVTRPVARPIPYPPGRLRDSANLMAATVASAEAQTLTRLLPMRIVMRSLSFFFLILESDFAPARHSLTYPWMVCWESDIRAISVPEKNADNPTSNAKIKKDVGSITKVRM